MNSKSSTTAVQPTCSREQALKYATVLFGCYRRGDAESPEIYINAAVSVMTCYSETIVRSITDPRSGLPSTSKFLPTIFEIRAACDAKIKPLIDAEKRMKTERENAADRPKESTPEDAARRKAFIAKWREDMEAQRQVSDGTPLHEMDARKIKSPELKQAVLDAHEAHLAQIAERSRETPIAVGPDLQKWMREQGYPR